MGKHVGELLTGEEIERRKWKDPRIELPNKFEPFVLSAGGSILVGAYWSESAEDGSPYPGPGWAQVEWNGWYSGYAVDLDDFTYWRKATEAELKEMSW
jgi:hypothetical protein